jgi:hypothetical protein
VNQWPTTALFSCSLDMALSLVVGVTIGPRRFPRAREVI